METCQRKSKMNTKVLVKMPIGGEVSKIVERQLQMLRDHDLNLKARDRSLEAGVPIPVPKPRSQRFSSLKDSSNSAPNDDDAIPRISERLSGNNRQLLKEMIEKYHKGRRLSSSLRNNENDNGNNGVQVPGPVGPGPGLLVKVEAQQREETQNEHITDNGEEDELSTLSRSPRLTWEETRRHSESSDLIQFDVEEDASDNDLRQDDPSSVITGVSPISLAAVEVEVTTIPDLEIPNPNLPNPPETTGTEISYNERTCTSVGRSTMAAIAAPTHSHSLDNLLSGTSMIERPLESDTSDNVTSSRSHQLSTSLPSFDDSPGELRVSHKVVWFTPRSCPETGIVKWIGKIKGRYHAGVEFENPVGNSSGLYSGKKLFNCKLTHGRFVPVSELILHLDFYSGSCSNAPSRYSSGIPELNDAQESTNFKNMVYEPPIVCVICQDPLLISDDDDLDMNASVGHTETESKIGSGIVQGGSRARKNQQGCSSTKEMVTTKCGHLFHSSCLSQWFMKKNRMQQPCPYCQKLMNIQDTIRIYPVQGYR